MPDISVIMVTYNSAGVVEAALNAVFADPEVAACYVVDNASSDGTAAFIRQKFPQAILIENPENRGFGAGCNRALEKVTTSFALVLNPDAVPEKGALHALLVAAERYPQAAILAPLLRNAEGGFDTSFKRNVFHRERHRAIWQAPEGDVSVECVSGAAMLLRMEYLRPLGFFDPAIFFYYEDDDICLRAHTEKQDVIVVPSAVVLHDRGHSSVPSAALDAWKQRQLIISRLYLERKYRGEKAARALGGRIGRAALAKTLLYGLLLRRAKCRKHAARFAATVACGARGK